MSRPLYVEITYQPDGIKDGAEMRKMMLNECQIVGVSAGPQWKNIETAIIQLPSGQDIVVFDPPYEAWLNDLLMRKQ